MTTRFRFSAAALLFSPLVASAALAAEGLAPAPRELTPPPAALMGIIDPATLTIVSPSPTTAAPRLIPNVFPAPGEIPAGKSEPPGSPSDGAPTIFVTGAEKPAESILAPPLIDRRFDAPYDGGVAPPDPVMAVGRGHVVTLINLLIGFYTKTGALVGGPYSLASFFNIPAGFSTFDPLALYDPFADRFIVFCTADNGSAQDSRIFVAFSQTGDPTKPWNKYFIDADAGQAGNWADYPSSGLDRLAVYATANMFARGGGFSNVTLFIYNKDDGYAGRALRSKHLIDVRMVGGGSPFRLRPAFVPEVTPGDEYFLAHTDSTIGDRINLFRLTGERFGSPQLVPSTVATDGMFFQYGGARQPGGNPTVSTLGSPLWNVYYRRGTLWTAHAVSGSLGIAAKVHKLNVAVNPATRQQSWSLEAAGFDSYFPHVLPDAEDDDFALLTAYSGSSQYVTGRYWNVSADGTVRAAELTANGALRNNSERHGDYLAIGADPLDRNRVWMIAQYMKNGTFSGNSGVASVRFEDVPVPTPPPPTPGGAGLAGQPVRVTTAAGGQLNILWDAATCPAPGYHLVWFDVSALKDYSPLAETCAVGTSGAWTGAPPAGGAIGVLVVSDDASSAEGSHGEDGAGRERPSRSSACGFAQKIFAATCGP